MYLEIDEIKEKKTKSPLVVHSNDLIVKTAEAFTLNQLKIFFYVLSQIPRAAETIPIISVGLDDLIRLTGIDEGDSPAHYREYMKETLASLARQLIYAIDKKSSLYLTTWFDYIEIDELGQRYDFKLKKLLEPFLLHLTQSFTKYQLVYMLGFKSTHAIRLYDLLQGMCYRQSVSFTLDEFRNRMSLKKYDRKGNIVGDEYLDYKSILKRVLKPAISEINEKSDILVTYLPLKDKNDGRKTAGIQFDVALKENPPRYDYAIPRAVKLTNTEELPELTQLLSPEAVEANRATPGITPSQT